LISADTRLIARDMGGKRREEGEGREGERERERERERETCINEIT